MKRILIGIAMVAVAGAWFAWLRPTPLGGAVSYVVVKGSSMKPTYEDGDLVLVREEDHYRHGDIIAFRAGGHFDDPTRIIHRIVGDAPDGRFRTQGDNRDELDPWQPGPEDIIGRATLHVPMAGDATGLLARPEALAAAGGTAAVIGGNRRRKRRRRLPAGHGDYQEEPMTEPSNHAGPVNAASAPPRLPSRLASHTQPRWAFIGLLASLALALPVLGLAWSALRAPDTTQRFQQLGSIDFGIGVDYRFTGPPSAVYPTGDVVPQRDATGALVSSEPLYQRLLDELQATIAPRVGDRGADSVAAEYAVAVRIETPDGWSTDLPGIQRAPVDGATAETVSVDLRSAAEQVASVASLTGVGGRDFSIVIEPTLEVRGAGGDVSVEDTIAAPMRFSVEGDVITAEAADAFRSEPLTMTVAERAHYSVGPFTLRTQTARAVLSGLALVVVAGIAWFASVLFGGVGLGEPARIAARYRSHIVDVTAASAPPGPVVMVGAIEELVRIAKVDQNVILHEDLGDGAHRYHVFTGTMTYEFETAPEHGGAAAQSGSPDESEGAVS